MLRELNMSEMDMVSGGTWIGLSVPGDQNGNGLADEHEDMLIESGQLDEFTGEFHPSLIESHGVWEPGANNPTDNTSDTSTENETTNRDRLCFAWQMTTGSSPDHANRMCGTEF